MSVKELTKLTVTDLWKEYKGMRDFWEKQEEAVKGFKRTFIESALEVERDMVVGCKRHERKEDRRDYRNGYWKRWITLKDGVLKIRMPRIRGMGYESAIIPRYKQRIDAASLDADVRRYHQRKIEDKYLYLFLDGIVLKVRTGFGSKKKVVLVAYGIKVDGKREIIDFMVTRHESERKMIDITSIRRLDYTNF